MRSIIAALLVTFFAIPQAGAMSPDPGLERWVEFEDPGANAFAEAIDHVPRRGGHSTDFNPYNYARSNPLRYTDPTGYFPEERHNNPEDRQVARDYAPMLGDSALPGDAIGTDPLLDPTDLVVPLAEQACKVAIRGTEFTIGKMRFAPFGNRTGHPTGEWPHYHRTATDAGGNTIPGGSGKRHRPWDTRSTDRSFWDRF